MRARSIVAALVGLTLVGCDTAERTDDAAAFAFSVELVNAVPTGPERADRMTEEEFLSSYQRYEAEFGAAGAGEAETWPEALVRLEDYLADFGPVTAHVSTDPSGLEVTYRRVHEPPREGDPGVTSNDSVRLDIPADYWFDCRNPYTGDVESKRRECRYGCSVNFVFTQPGA